MKTSLFASIFGQAGAEILNEFKPVPCPDGNGCAHAWIPTRCAQEVRHAASLRGCDAILLTVEQTAMPKCLLIMDFDSTLVTSEGLDLLAEAHGVGLEVAAITSRAMRGEMDFAQSLASRLATLAGMELAQIDTLAKRQPLQPGMRELVQQVQAAGVETAIVSGGFDRLIAPIAVELGIRRIVCNHFALDGERLCGAIDGELIDANAKRTALLAICGELEIDPMQTIALGDGANDIPMLAAAGIGIALHPKPKVLEEIPNALAHNSPACLACLLRAYPPSS